MDCHTRHVPKGDVIRVGDHDYGRVDRTRTLAVCNTDARMYALALNRVLAQACAVAISSDQRGFIAGTSIQTSVALCEAAMREASMVSVEAAGISLTLRMRSRCCLAASSGWSWSAPECHSSLSVLSSLFVFGGEVVACVEMLSGV